MDVCCIPFGGVAAKGYAANGGDIQANPRSVNFNEKKCKTISYEKYITQLSSNYFL